MPKWVRKRIRKLGVYPGNQVPSILIPMCEHCNGTFGKRFENEMAPILGPMMDGEQTVLSPADQEIVGRWIIKTVLLGAINPRTTMPSPQRELIRSLCCHMRDHGTPPHQSFVRLAGFDQDRPADAPGHDDLHRNGYLPDALLRAAQVSGHVAWEVVVGAPETMERFVAHCPKHTSLLQIWPPQLAALQFPPSAKLVYRDVLRLRLAWQEKIWPPPEDGLLPSPIGTQTAGFLVNRYPPSRP